MRIIVANPPWKVANRVGVRAGSRWPWTVELNHPKDLPVTPFPFFLAYTTSLLKKNNYDVEFIDAIAEGLEDEVFFERIKNFNPDIFLMETSTPSIDVDLQYTKTIKDKFKCKTVLCGPHVSIFGREILEKYEFVDYILVGEYEYTFLELVDTLKNDGNLEHTLGLIYRGASGNVCYNGRRPLIENLDELPFPYREHFPFYKDTFCDLPTPTLQLLSSRGCPYRCIFCMWPQVMYGGHRYRVRSAKNIIEEILYFVNKYNYKSFYFDDDTFNIIKKRTMEIAEKIKEAGLNELPWGIMARADTMDEETLFKLKEAGLFAVKYGIESGVQEILDRSGKNLKLGKAIEIIKLTKKLGINVHLTFMFGLPGETKKTIKTTLNLMKMLDPDSVQFSIVVPFPGTEYYEILKKENRILSENFSDYNGNRKAIFYLDDLSPTDLENSLLYAKSKWAAHLFRKNLKKELAKYLVKAISNPLRIIRSGWKLWR